MSVAARAAYPHPGFRPVLAWSRAHRALTGGLIVLALAAPALLLTHHAPVLPLGKAAALRALAHDSRSAGLLRGVRWTRSELYAIDAGSEQINLYDGARVAYEAVVRTDGTVQMAVDPAKLSVPYGSQIAYRSSVLIGLSLLFVLLGGVAPLRRIRNLDVAALLTTAAPLLLLQHRLIGASVVAAVPPLLYLAVRCSWEALTPGRPPTVQRPLIDLALRGMGGRERRRLMLLLGAAAALVYLMVGVSSNDAVDVIYAVMAGATKLLHGSLPYGHLPSEIIHGDTYPILSYALFVPVALAEPVTSVWDSVDLALAVGVASALVAAAATAGAVARTQTAYARIRPRAVRRSDDDPVSPDTGAGPQSPAVDPGLRAGLLLLCFPPLLAIVSTGTTDVLLGAMLVIAIVLWRRPTAASAVIAVAGWFKLAPFVLLPIWLAPLRGRRLAVALAAVLGVSVGSLAIVVVIGGGAGLGAMVKAIGYQFSRGSFQSVWHSLGVDGLQPVGQALVLAFVAGTAIRLRSDAVLARDPHRIAALAAACLILLQLAANYWAALYLAWLAPLLIVALLGAPPGRSSRRVASGPLEAGAAAQSAL